MYVDGFSHMKLHEILLLPWFLMRQLALYFCIVQSFYNAVESIVLKMNHVLKEKFTKEL